MNKIEELIGELNYDCNELFYKNRNKEYKIKVIDCMLVEIEELTELLEKERKVNGKRMKVKDFKEVLEQYGDNTEIYIRYTGDDIEIETGDTFKTKGIEAEYDSLVINIV